MKSKLLAAATLRAQLEKSKSDWVTAAMAKILPPDVFAQCTSGDANDRMAAQKYLVRNKIYIAEEPHRSTLIKDGHVLTEMTVQIKRGVANVMTRDYPEPEPEA